MVKSDAVGAHYGTRDWLLQRLSAVILVLFFVVLVVRFCLVMPRTYEHWQLFFRPTWFRIGTFGTFAAMCFHAWIGMRDIIMDYVKFVSIRLSLYFVIALLLMAYIVWMAVILWR